MADSTLTDLPLSTNSITKTSTTSSPSITSSDPPTFSSNDHFRTIFVTITASAGPRYSLNATEKIWHQRSNAIGQWSAIGVMGVYVLFALCLLIGWIVRCIRRKPKVRPSSLPPEVSQRDGSFLATETVGIRRGRARSGTTISAHGAGSTKRYSFEEPSGNRQTEISAYHEGPSYPLDRSLHNLNFEDQPYLSPTISTSPPRSSHRLSSGIYNSGRRHYSSSQTNLIPLQNPASQYHQQSLGEESRTTSRGRNRSSSQSTLRYYFAQSEDDYYESEPEPPVPPVSPLHIPDMAGVHDGRTEYPHASVQYPSPAYI